MVLPNLIHPIAIVIEQITTGGTIYDPDTREPIQQAARAARVTCPGQVSWTLDKSYRPEPQGPQEESIGYIMFRYADLNALGITIKREDRFAKMGWQDTDVYVTKVQPMGHYPDQNGASLVRCYFKDRQPSKQTKG